MDQIHTTVLWIIFVDGFHTTKSMKFNIYTTKISMRTICTYISIIMV